MRHGRRVLACGDEARDVGDVREEQGADAARDLAHPREIDDARVGGRADRDHLRLLACGDLGEFVVVDQPVRLAHADRKSTRLNSSHVKISYAVSCLKKKTEESTSELQ